MLIDENRDEHEFGLRGQKGRARERRPVVKEVVKASKKNYQAPR
jgi:hypothetical protein